MRDGPGLNFGRHLNARESSRSREPVIIPIEIFREHPHLAGSQKSPPSTIGGTPVLPDLENLRVIAVKTIQSTNPEN
jgi:hypothetical protein